MTTQEVILVKPEFVPDIWSRVRPLIEKALDHSRGELHSSDILRTILNKKDCLWVGLEDGDIKTALVTTIINSYSSK